MLNSNHLSTEKEIISAYWSYTSNLVAPEAHSHSNQKRFWSYTKAVRKENINISVLKSNGTCYNTSLDKAKVLNHQFQSVCKCSNRSKKSLYSTCCFSAGHCKALMTIITIANECVRSLYARAE